MEGILEGRKATDPVLKRKEKTMDDKTQKIAALNDGLRTSFDLAKGQIYLTRGVADLQAGDRSKIIDLVRTFNQFTEDNDPYMEHDFGKVSHNGHDVFFKIDYYDPKLEYHSEDAADPEKTVRVLTIMLASEY